MTVRELIEQLKHLEQDTKIWVLYDCVSFLEPNIDVVEDNSEYESKRGDYYFMAW